jgi:hypothetical protein
MVPVPSSLKKEAAVFGTNRRLSARIEANHSLLARGEDYTDNTDTDVIRKEW